MKQNDDPPILVFEGSEGVIQIRHPKKVSKEECEALRKTEESYWAEFDDNGNVIKCDDKTRFLMGKNR